MGSFCFKYIRVYLADMNIVCKVYCKCDAAKLYSILNSNEGRASFWAESAREENGVIHFSFPNGQVCDAPILSKTAGKQISFFYFDTDVTINLYPEQPGTTVEVVNDNVPDNEYAEIKAGWVSVLMALKASVDHGVDLRNHSAYRNWDTAYIDN